MPFVLEATFHSSNVHLKGFPELFFGVLLAFNKEIFVPILRTNDYIYVDKSVPPLNISLLIIAPYSIPFPRLLLVNLSE